MLKNNAFLRKLPVCLELKHRLTLQAIGFSLDGLSFSYNQMRLCAEHIANTNIDELGQEENIPLFIFAWSMIDRIHMLRTLLKTLNLKPDGVSEKFTIDHVSATLARNYLDHIHQNLDNLSKSKSARPPVFGSMNFYAIDEHHLREEQNGTKELVGCRAITVMAGDMTGQHLFKVAEHLGGRQIEHPVGRFELSVHDFIVDLSQAIIDARKVADHFESTVKAGIEARIREAAFDQGFDPEELITTTGGNLVFQAEITFQD